MSFFEIDLFDACVPIPAADAAEAKPGRATTSPILTKLSTGFTNGEGRDSKKSGVSCQGSE